MCRNRIAGLYYHLYLQDAIEEFGVDPDGPILDEDRGSGIIVTHPTSPFTPDQFLQFCNRMQQPTQTNNPWDIAPYIAAVYIARYIL